MLCCCLAFANKNTLAVLTIKGITGKALANVDTRLTELQQLKPLTELDEEELQHQIRQSLQPYGYFKAVIRIQLLNHKEFIIDIKPGPPMRVASVTVKRLGEGAENPALINTLSATPLKAGAPLLTEQYLQAKQDILNRAQQLGYLHATFQKAELLIDKNSNTAQITLIFDTGPLHHFGQVQFDPTYISPELLHRFIPFKSNQPYSTEKIIEFNNYLSGSGYFSAAVVKPQITTSPSVPVTVHLQPVSKYAYSLGVGYGTDTGPRGRAGLQIIPVNRKGHKFSATAQGSMTQSTVQGQYIIPGANPITDQYTLTGNYSSLNYNAGYSNASLFAFAQQHNLNHYQRTLSLNSLYESFHYTYQPNANQFLLYPKATFTFNKTQNQLFSPSGFNLSFNGLGASQSTLSEVTVAQIAMDAKAAMTIDPIRLRLYGHLIQGATAIDHINQLPISLALLLGGTDNLKAQSFNSVGPGRITSYGGFEIQKETIKNWYLVGFYDAGTVYNPSPKNVLYDAGGGLMWVSPIGPIKVGLAQAINYQFKRTGSRPRLVISMGPDL